MNPFTFYSPTRLYVGENCIVQNKDVFRSLGKKALLVTGKFSAKNNGSQQDVIDALTAVGISYATFDKVEENPSIETVATGTELGIAEGVDFIIGIGGGSPIDAGKAMGVLIKNRDYKVDDLFAPGLQLSALPVLTVPTTAGSSSETTPFAVMTVHKDETKKIMAPLIFPAISFLDAKYMMDLPQDITANTAVDALTHLIEGYLTLKANFMSDRLNEMGFSVFASVIDALKRGRYTFDDRARLLLTSTIGGIAITHTGACLPHRLGYALAFFKGIPHGRANGLLQKAWLDIYEDKTKINTMLSILGFKDITALGEFLNEILVTSETFDETFVRKITDQFTADMSKTDVHPFPLTREDIYNIYAKSLLGR